MKRYRKTFDSNRATLTYPDTTVIAYGYTGRNQLASVSTLATYTYDPAGNRTGKTLGNSTTTGYTYDDASRLTQIAHSNTGGVFAQFDYALNAVGNRTNMVGTAGSAVRSESYSYDPTDQLTGVNYVTNSLPERTVAYQYDPVGNRTLVTDNLIPTAYTANNLNQYTLVGLDLPTYDNNGNLTGQSVWTYTYDAQNRLVSATSASSAATFSYDPRNRCVSRTINSVTTYLTYDGWSILEDRDSSGTLLDKYVHGAMIDELLVRYNGSPIWYHHDGLGSTTHLTDNTGTIVESYRYDAFGAVSVFDASGSPLSASAFSNRFLFTGREWLAEIGLYDYRNRMYSQTLGRFLQTDPLRNDVGDINFYGYAWDNPVTESDPTGLSPLIPIIGPNPIATACGAARMFKQQLRQAAKAWNAGSPAWARGNQCHDQATAMLQALEAAGLLPSGLLTYGMIGGQRVVGRKTYCHWATQFEWKESLKTNCCLKDFTLDPFKFKRNEPALAWFINPTGNVWTFWGTPTDFKRWWPGPECDIGK